jgi:hypothetical protein
MTIVRSIVRPIVRAIVSAIVPAATGGQPSEYVVNGGFASGAGWTLGTGWSIGGGVATQSGADMFAPMYSTLAAPVTVGAAYTLSGTLTDASNVGANISLMIGTPPGETLLTVGFVQGSGAFSVPIALGTIDQAYTQVHVASNDNVGTAAYSIDNLSLVPAV